MNFFSIHDLFMEIHFYEWRFMCFFLGAGGELVPKNLVSATF